MDTTLSPLAPKSFPQLAPVAGVRFATGNAGLRYKSRDDIMIAEFVPGTTAAGVFTKSKTCSAAVDWCREALSSGKARALIVNAGNANAFTGKLGVKAVEDTVDGAAKLFDCKHKQVFVASTGTIGVPLDASKLVSAMNKFAPELEENRWEKAARAIMTTDTFAKGATATTEIDGVPVTISGFAKGSGMIAPDMATMLGYVFTDAQLPADVLQELLKDGTDKSFNSITVDSDTSTSDSLMLFATGQAKHAPITKAKDKRMKAFRQALNTVLIDLAQQVVRDGEGATKFVTVEVTGAASDKAARKIGLAIANSPLVKTAIAGEDANWGRIVMAVGKSGEKADRDALVVSIGGIPVAANGEVVPDYDETPVAKHFQGLYIDLSVDVGVGKGKATVWTCDLTHGYITINADYRS